MNNQNTKVRKFIEYHGGITSLNAFKFLGVTRLSARIYDLKKLGLDIACKWVSVKTRDGKNATVKQYRLEKK